MTAPKWHEYMAPSLRAISDGEVWRSRDIVAAAADLLAVTDEQRAIMIPSGQHQWVNRSNWALSYLNRVHAIDRVSRGKYRITDIGRKLLAEHPDGITEKDLRALSGDPNAPHTWKAFPVQPSADVPDQGSAASEESGESSETPTEQIENGIARIHAEVAADLLHRIHAQEPQFFEQCVLDLLMAMGYGGAEGSATRTQLSSDGGIDGIVDQDALGLSRIYVQAKRYAQDNIVQRPAIQGFVGALAGNQANQGVFITTSSFTRGARDYADSVPARVVLIDGERFARLMIRYGVGVQVTQRVNVVEVDSNYFDDP